MLILASIIGPNLMPGEISSSSWMWVSLMYRTLNHPDEELSGEISFRCSNLILTYTCIKFSYIVFTNSKFYLH